MRRCMVAYHSLVPSGQFIGTVELTATYPPTVEVWKEMQGRVSEWARDKHGAIKSVVLSMTPLAEPKEGT